MYRQVRMSVELLALTALLLVGVNLGGCKSAEEPVDAAAATDPADADAQSSTAETYPADRIASLAGTDWRLVEFQSMDDVTGTVRPEDPSLYTLRLKADGTQYVEHERVPGETQPEGIRYLAGEFTFEDGIPLEPHT